MPNARPSSRTRTVIWTAAVLLVVLVFYLAHIATRTVLQVRAFTVTRGSIETTVSTNGKVQPVVNFEAHAPFPGLVTAVYVHEGDQVPKGKLLLTMDDSEARTRVAQAQSALAGAISNEKIMEAGGSPEERYTFNGQLDQAQAELAQAQKSLATMQSLESKGAASPGEVAHAQGRVDSDLQNLQVLQQRQQAHKAMPGLEQARAQVVEAKAALAAAQDAVAESQVRAPYAGTVYSLSVNGTEYAQQGDRLLQIANLNNLQVLAYFDEPDIGKLALQLPVLIKWTARPDQSWHGHITRMPATIVTQSTRNVGEVVCSVDDNDSSLLPDTNVDVTVTTKSVANALYVPREALHIEQGLNYVYKVQRGKLKRVQVQIDNLNLTQVQILSGINEGDVIALNSLSGRLLTNGVAVDITS